MAMNSPNENETTDEAGNDDDNKDRNCHTSSDAVPRDLLLPQHSITKDNDADSTLSPYHRRGKLGLPLRMKSDFALKSIRRGTVDWNQTLRPFVANIVFESCEQTRRSIQPNDITCNANYQKRFRPYTCHAAVLFVDLCNYSKITSTIAHRGAHVLSSIVNEYLHRILVIVHKYGGDVIKFAGDAIIVVWYSSNEENLPINVLIAAKCVLEMQQYAGEHPVRDTSLQFRIHCGLSCGMLESEIYTARNHINMQRLFHSVGGNSLVELSELVDVAKPGEVCVSNGVTGHLLHFGTFIERTDDFGTSFYLLVSVKYDKDVMSAMNDHIETNMCDQQSKRINMLEEEFIHPNVIKLLSHSGLSPTQISQMRNLCILFIAMTSSFGSTVNWLTEVQTILDKHRCPIVQMLDDDKGVHLVAAVNLAESIPESSLVGLEICRELITKQVGCVIGMASGSTFCGVVGSSDIACRWDIAGPPPVRAARLMQYALLSENCNVAIDQSVYDDPISFTRMTLFDPAVKIKGTAAPIPIYTLSNCKSSTAFRVLETVHGRVHDDLVDQITKHINGDSTRVAIVATGIPLAGKKIVCQRAAGNADLVPYLHLSDESAGFLQLARTFATWFQYADDEAVRTSADSVLELLTKQHWSRSHDECIALVDLALQKGLRACFVIDRIQFLDEFSMSLIRECLCGRSMSPQKGRRSSSGALITTQTGKFCLLCVHVPFYNGKSVSDVVNDLSRSNPTLHVPVINVGEATNEGLLKMFRDLSDMEVDDRWLNAYAEASGNCAGYFIERVAAIRTKSSKLWSEGKRPYAETSERLVLHIPYGLVGMNKTLSVMDVSAEVAMRFHQLFDELPPLCQTALKVLTVASRGGYLFHIPSRALYDVLNDLIADGVEWDLYTTILDEMKELHVIKIQRKDDIVVLSFQCPAFADVAYDVSTPEQIRSIALALVERLQPLVEENFVVPLVLARLYSSIGESVSKSLAFFVNAFRMLEKESVGWSASDKNKWMECIDDEMSSSGHKATEILGEDFKYDKVERKIVGKILPLIKIYSAPVSFGPAGHSLSVICRNTFHEFGICSGAYNSEATKTIYDALGSASTRYLHQINLVELYLKSNGIVEQPYVLKEEQEIIQRIVQQAKDGYEVQRKAELILYEYIPRFVDRRILRLHSLVNLLHGKDIPDVILSADKAIYKAYLALRADKDTTDATQDAVVIMATMNWKPKPVPEYLPLLHYQTVARIRNKVLKRLNETELFMFKHQQNHLDLEAFLIVTALLNNNPYDQ